MSSSPPPPRVCADDPTFRSVAFHSIIPDCYSSISARHESNPRPRPMDTDDVDGRLTCSMDAASS